MPPRRTRKPGSPLDIVDPRFEGTAYSIPECVFLLEHLGEPAIIALPDDSELPEGVNEIAVAPLLERTYQLDLYEQAMREKSGNAELHIWVGFEALRAILQETLNWRGQVQELKRRTRGSSAEVRRAAGAPSLHLWDPSTDVPYLGGVGADADRVLTALNEHGQRIELHTELQQMGVGSIRSLAGVASFVKSKSAAEQSNKLMEGPEDLVYDEGETQAVVKCPICGLSEPYQMNKPSEKRTAVAKVMRHLIAETVTKVDAHRLLHQRLKSGKAGARTNRVTAVQSQSMAEQVAARG